METTEFKVNNRTYINKTIIIIIIITSKEDVSVHSKWQQLIRSTGTVKN